MPTIFGKDFMRLKTKNLGPSIGLLEERKEWAIGVLRTPRRERRIPLFPLAWEGKKIVAPWKRKHATPEHVSFEEGKGILRKTLSMFPFLFILLLLNMHSKTCLC